MIADISASATTMLITDGDQNLFPSKFPFLLTLEHLDSEWNVILREIVKATAWNQNSYTVVRWAWTCVQDDTASNRSQDNTAHAFYSWDRVSLYRTSEQVKDIQDRLETSANDTAIADEYSSSQTYTIWDIVMYKWDRYVCSTDVSTAEEFDSTKWTKVSVQYDLAQAQEDIEILKNSWWSSDHLEEECLVWEKYVATDKLFKQETPSLDNSTVDYNIWDVATNTQVHIQRIGSWVASNTVKLKVKMTWSPTTALHCDVYEWTSYDVSSTEKAWTWTTLLASSQVAYTSISSSYAEITFTLDNEIWWTEWQLLDVVVYQDNNTVNASNYYQIACDSTQYSEAFRCVSVNGSTKTPSYLMPYCSSDWFAQYLLCKVSFLASNLERTWNISSGISWNSTSTVAMALTNPTNQPIKVPYSSLSITCRANVNSAIYVGLRVYDSSWTWTSNWINYGYATTTDATYTWNASNLFSLPAWSSLRIWFYNSTSTSRAYVITKYEFHFDWIDKKNNIKSEVSWYAVNWQIFNIWEMWKFAFRWINNWEFYTTVPIYDTRTKYLMTNAVVNSSAIYYRTTADVEWQYMLIASIWYYSWQSHSWFTLTLWDKAFWSWATVRQWETFVMSNRLKVWDTIQVYDTWHWNTTYYAELRWCLLWPMWSSITSMTASTS